MTLLLGSSLSESTLPSALSSNCVAFFMSLLQIPLKESLSWAQLITLHQALDCWLTCRLAIVKSDATLVQLWQVPLGWRICWGGHSRRPWERTFLWEGALELIWSTCLEHKRKEEQMVVEIHAVDSSLQIGCTHFPKGALAMSSVIQVRRVFRVNL